MDTHGFKKFDAFYGSRSCICVPLLWGICSLHLPHIFIWGVCLRLNVTRNHLPSRLPIQNFVHTSLSHLFSNIFRDLSLQCELNIHIYVLRVRNISRRSKFTFRSSGLWHRDRSFRGTCCRLLQKWYANILKEILATRPHGVTTRNYIVHNHILVGLTFLAICQFLKDVTRVSRWWYLEDL